MWMKSHASHAMNPVSRILLPISAMAENREIVAMEPLSKYLNGCCGAFSSDSRALTSLAAYFPPWIATWATPGRWSRLIMSPTTNTSGWPGSVRSGFTEIRPARSTGAPVWSLRTFPSGLACTPAAHTLVVAGMRRWVPPTA